MAFSEVAFVNGPGFDMRGECAVTADTKKPRRCRALSFILFKYVFLTDFALSLRLAPRHFLVKYSIK
ncbi:hypothetical protein B6171_004842 [Salmonella enterica subsp. enterica serovar Miami]|nr:hypothetical protein [Salmonella enterica subsp. enterica serovar Miami]EDO3656236.1 hypothetical protein [Salmonella enterica]EEE1025353.1 hypothetical protein [Salmonella enterica subsp. enterica serovar Miami]